MRTFVLSAVAQGVPGKFDGTFVASSVAEAKALFVKHLRNKYGWSDRVIDIVKVVKK